MFPGCPRAPVSAVDVQTIRRCSWARQSTSPVAIWSANAGSLASALSASAASTSFVSSTTMSMSVGTASATPRAPSARAAYLRTTMSGFARASCSSAVASPSGISAMDWTARLRTSATGEPRPSASSASPPSPDCARAHRRAPATFGSVSLSAASTSASTGTGTSSTEDRAARWRFPALSDPSAWRSATIWRTSSQPAGSAAPIRRSRVSSSVSPRCVLASGG